MKKDEMKNRISMALKDPILQQGFELICKENAELKEQLESEKDLHFIAYMQGAEKQKKKDEEELKKWKSEWNEQVIKANEEGFERTKQTIKLSKAKELIEDMYDKIPASHSDYYKDVMERARQFLSEVDKCLKKKN